MEPQSHGNKRLRVPALELLAKVLVVHLPRLWRRETLVVAAVLVLLELLARERPSLLMVVAARFPASQALLWSMAVAVEGRRVRP